MMPLFLLTNLFSGFMGRATNVIVRLLLVCVLSGVGLAIGSKAAEMMENPKMESVLEILGGGIGLLVALVIRLPGGVQTGAEWVIRLAIGAAFAFALYVIFEKKGINQRIVNRCLKVETLGKLVQRKQADFISRNADSFYVLLKYEELIQIIFERQKEKSREELSEKFERLQKEKEAKIAEADAVISDENERKIAEERQRAADAEDAMRKQKVKLEEAKTKLGQLEFELDSEKGSQIEKLNRELADLNDKLENLDQKYEIKIKNSWDVQAKEINAIAVERSEYLAEMENALADMRKLFSDINNNTVGFEESKGVVSDYLYLFNEEALEEPKEFHVIRHDKKPLVFLYELDESTNVSASLYPFMQAVLASIYTINAGDAFEVIISDPVSKARKFEQLASRKLLKIESDIRELSASVQESMRRVAQQGMSIDDYNRKMYEDREDKVKYCKYKIVEFIVPEEASAQNTNFFDSDLWGMLGDGHENGFIPIFYISYSDWKNTFDSDSRLNSKFIIQLKNAIGKSNGSVYKIDIDSVNIEKIS